MTTVVFVSGIPSALCGRVDLQDRIRHLAQRLGHRAACGTVPSGSTIIHAVFGNASRRRTSRGNAQLATLTGSPASSASARASSAGPGRPRPAWPRGRSPSPGSAQPARPADQRVNSRHAYALDAPQSHRAARVARRLFRDTTPAGSEAVETADAGIPSASSSRRSSARPCRSSPRPGCARVCPWLPFDRRAIRSDRQAELVELVEQPARLGEQLQLYHARLELVQDLLPEPAATATRHKIRRSSRDPAHRNLQEIQRPKTNSENARTGER